MSPIKSKARERILQAAYELFTRRGVRAVGVDTIIERAGVARQTLYRHFPSKNDLVLAFLNNRGERWTKQWLIDETRRRAASPPDRLLAVFDLYDEWFHARDFAGCPFINTLLEFETDGEIHKAAAGHLSLIRQFAMSLAREARLSDPATLGDIWHVLMVGAIVSAKGGNRDAARKAKRAAEAILARWGQ